MMKTTEPAGDLCANCGEAETVDWDLCDECNQDFQGYDSEGRHVFELAYDDYLLPRLASRGVGREVVVAFCAARTTVSGGRVDPPGTPVDWEVVASDYIWDCHANIDYGFDNLVADAVEWATLEDGAAVMARSLLVDVTDPLRAEVAHDEVAEAIAADLKARKKQPEDDYYRKLAHSLADQVQ